MKRNKTNLLIILLFITSFLLSICFINNVNALSDNLRYDFKKNILITSNKTNINLRHNDINTQEYNASYSFIDDIIGNNPLYFGINEAKGTIKVIEYMNYHKSIVEFNHNDELDGNVRMNSTISQTNGIIEYWIQANSSSKITYLIIKDGVDTNAIYMKFDNDGYLKYYDTEWHIIQEYNINIWYHIKIVFECGNDGLEGLSPDTFYITINKIKKGSYNMRGSPITMDIIEFNAYSGINSLFYLDALGYNWLSNYSVGINEYSIIEIIDSNILSNDKYEFNLNESHDPYPRIEYQLVDFWTTVNYAYVHLDMPHLFAKTKNINGINIYSEDDGSATGIRNQTLGLNQDKFNISFGFQIIEMSEINSYTIFKIYSLNNTEIIKLRFDTQTNTKTNLQYYDGSSYQDLVSIYGIISTNVYNFNLFIYNFSVDLSWYKNDNYNNTYSFPLISNLWGINQIHFYGYDPTPNIDYYILRLNYIGIYQFYISLAIEKGYIDYNLQNDWIFQQYNLFSVNPYNQAIKILGYGKIDDSYDKYIFREFDNNIFFWNLMDNENIIENAHLYLIIQSNFSFYKPLSLSINGIKLEKYINNVFDKEITIQYFFYNVNINQSYYYVDDSNRLHYKMSITQNDTWEYMMLYFDFTRWISSNNMSIYFKCRELSINIGKPYIAMTYYQPPDIKFYLKTYSTTINTLLIRGKELRRFHFISNDQNNNNYTNTISEGYLYGLQFNYVPFGIIPSIDFMTLSLLAIMIPLIIIIVPTIGIYSVYRKKEIVIPILLLTTIICYVSLLIPFELFFVMLLCYGCGIFIQYKKQKIE